MSPHELHAAWIQKQNFMSETNTTMEPVTETKIRKTRAKKAPAPHIAEVKKAVSTALRTEWLLQRAIAQHAKLVTEGVRNITTLINAARESWTAVQLKAADCAVAHIREDDPR
jgi:hypothetical protein